MAVPTPPAAAALIIDSSEGSSDEAAADDTISCRVCGQPGAQPHYGALACVGCKGFFRRALKKADQLECLGNGTCAITKDARTNCRSCRLRACLEAGMNPAAVRPDRDFTGRQRKTKKAPSRVEPSTSSDRIPNGSEDWNKRLSVEMRTMLMTLLNLEVKISRGDTTQETAKLYPLNVKTVREILEDPSKLKGKRSEMRYERDRLCKNHELSPIAYRRLIAAIDWVEYLSEYLPQKLSIEDRIALVKGCFLPLLVFKVSARTAVNTENENVLCMCNFTYIPRDICRLYDDCYHWNNGLVDRVLDELVTPYRKFGLREEEIVCLSAIVVLNPLYKDLSEEASNIIMEMRNKIQETLFAVMREGRPGQAASVLFGNILLSLPTVWTLANEMNENLVFAQTFSAQPEIPLMSNMFGFFPVEPLEDTKDRVEQLTISPPLKGMVDRACQTDHPLTLRAQKRRAPDSLSTLEEAEPRKMPFTLTTPPTDYIIAELFDDLEQEQSSQSPILSCQPSSSALPPMHRSVSSPKNNENDLRPRSSSTPTQPEPSPLTRSTSALQVVGPSNGFPWPRSSDRPPVVSSSRSAIYRTVSHPAHSVQLKNPSTNFPLQVAQNSSASTFAWPCNPCDMVQHFNQFPSGSANPATNYNFHNFL